ncbi:unnamed protein product [Brachionus calyciflorus]|uniref:Uncharacterized protein n=1 Tax=Brachionus calyciflorus TaxID=104777 RepID=A0A814CLY6_9BILA|nr:unnamed protein product [Brachionus calyciflorus]
MFINYLTFSLVVQINFVLIYSINHCLNYEPQCQCKSSERIECTNFNNFTKLNFKLPTNKKMPNLKHYYYMKISPNEPIKFDNALNLDDLNLDMNKFQLILNNIDSFELTSNPFLKYTQKTETPLSVISINNSSFKFVYRNKEFDWFCDLVTKDTELNPLFTSFKSLYLGHASYVNFKNKICPVVFKNTNLETLIISNMSLTNRLEFLPLDKLEINLNSKIRNFHLQSSEIFLDNSLLDKNVFKLLNKLSIEFSNLTGLSKDVLKPFKFLKSINLWLFNLDEFIINSGLDWLIYVNEDLRLFYDYEKLDKKFDKMKEIVSRRQVILELSDERGLYGYPESDFCLFKNFPHSRLIFPIIKTNRELECTCTVVWLVQFWKYAHRDLRTSSVIKCFNLTTISFDLMVYNCNFPKRLKSCFNNSIDGLSSKARNIQKSKAFGFKGNNTIPYHSHLVLFYFYFSYFCK